MRDASPPAHDTKIELEWNRIYEDWPLALFRDIELIIAQGLPDEFGTGIFVQGQMANDVVRSTNLKRIS